jgi:hypothetical protein
METENKTITVEATVKAVIEKYGRFGQNPNTLKNGTMLQTTGTRHMQKMILGLVENFFREWRPKTEVLDSILAECTMR